ncbi:MAG: phosphatidylglycerophosphatase A [Rhodospirillaceae bacterium]
MISTWFGSGLIPFAPGTWGSVAALPFAWVIYELWRAPGLMVATLLLFLLGTWASSIHARDLPDDDPSEIVVDEVVGQWMTLLVVPPDLLYYAIGFVLFRVFDIFKPWPVSWADRRIKGGLGIMLDDVLAAVYAAIVLVIVRYWIG